MREFRSATRGPLLWEFKGAVIGEFGTSVRILDLWKAVWELDARVDNRNSSSSDDLT